MIYSIDSKELQVDKYEALRYLGYARKQIADSDLELVTRYIEKVRPIVNLKACYNRYSIAISDDATITLPYGTITSTNLAENLKGCESIYIFAATIGAAFDRLLGRSKVESMSDAAAYQAVGAAMTEAFCNNLNDYLREISAAKGEKLHPRFSPGFGDYPLENQIGIFRVLDPYKHTGITLNNSLIMSPEKSVTAIIGIEKG